MEHISNTLLSFVIPSYNSGKFIEHSVQSILNQDIDLDLIEIIIIDDGSKDNTSEIVSNIILKYTNLRIIYHFQENAGVSSARNVGIKMSQGEYIWFIDSDDKIVDKCLSDIFDVILYSNTDIYCLGWIDRNGRKSFSFSDISGLLIGNKRKYNAANYIWNKIFKRSFLLNNSLFFSEQITNTEDFLFCVKALYSAKTIFNIKKVCYEYCLNTSSCSMNREERHMIQLAEHSLLMQNELLVFINKIPVDDPEYSNIFDLLSMNVNGLLFSLLRFNYSYKYIKSVLTRLKAKGIYPTPKTSNSRSNKFSLFSNCEFLYLLVCRINNYFKII